MGVVEPTSPGPLGPGILLYLLDLGAVVAVLDIMRTKGIERFSVNNNSSSSEQ